MNEEVIIKISLVVVSAFGLFILSQIYKPQIIEKTCDIVNYVAPSANMEPSQINNEYDYVIPLTILLIALKIIVGIAADNSEFIYQAVINTQQANIVNELNDLNNLGVVTNFLQNKDLVTELESVNYLKMIAKSFPIPIIEYNLGTLLNMEQFDNVIRYQFYELAGSEQLGPAAAAYIRCYLELEPFTEEIINHYNSFHENSGWGALANAYLYANIEILKYNPEIVSQFINKNHIEMFNLYTECFHQINKTNIISNPYSSQSLFDAMNYIIQGATTPGIRNNIEVGPGNLGLRYMAWGDLFCQKYAVNELANVKGFYMIDNTTYSIESVANALVRLSKNEDHYNSYLFCKNIIKTIVDNGIKINVK